jgi:hypothetical protein
MKTTTKAGKLERFAHVAKDRTGRYEASSLCDGCNKPVGTNYYSDEDVCGSGDGPGFYRCDRKRCAAKLEGLTVEQREAIYTSNRNAR